MIEQAKKKVVQQKSKLFEGRHLMVLASLSSLRRGGCCSSLVQALGVASWGLTLWLVNYRLSKRCTYERQLDAAKGFAGYGWMSLMMDCTRNRFSR